MTWQRWCALVGIHPLDCTQLNAQMFVDWMVSQYTSASVSSRVCGVAKWMDALVDGGLDARQQPHTLRRIAADLQHGAVNGADQPAHRRRVVARQPRADHDAI